MNGRKRLDPREEIIIQIQITDEMRGEREEKDRLLYARTASSSLRYKVEQLRIINVI